MIRPSSRTARVRLGATALAALTLFGTAACGATAHDSAPRAAAAVAAADHIRPGVTERDDLRAVFDAAGVHGSFALLDVNSRATTVVDRRLAETPLVPASSFKVPHALVALETGAVKSPDEVIPWDGTPQPFPEWEQDMTMREAIRISNAAAFQVIARRIGLQRERQWLHRFGYGNRQTGTKVDRFWLDGPLKISAVEQTRFLERLAAERLPASRANQRTVRDLIKQEEKDGYTLYAKSGWQNAPGPGTGWWVGWVDRGGRVSTFALNIDIVKDGDAAKRATVTRELLQRLNVLPKA
ncbi:beta-lactamase class D [Actinomadura coerulea]|uniref:Beta-lactamase n=1 Tax=Actinomadura coerulea TaxID=46159 RepID=A0A7X0G4Q8_9ACTN|nr:class D beta-lactamase [Actinomadura coerulea]MBB6399425.1 beta-lactamase class D [Actinomadura coerulea]GGQ28795.1 oxacillin-hydrolyzing class D beta-lactamase OXA-50 [Actinomadura coerulea]